MKARRAGLRHRAPDGTELERTTAPREPAYDAGAIRREVASLAEMDTGWSAWFARERLEPLRLRYDELATDPRAALGAVLGYLGVDPGLARGVTSPVARLADATSERWKSRFLADEGA